MLFIFIQFSYFNIINYNITILIGIFIYLVYLQMEILVSGY